MNREERFGQALKYKNNEYLKNTYIRPEKIDGEITPNGVIRRFNNENTRRIKRSRR